MESPSLAPLDILRHGRVAVATMLAVELLAVVNWVQDPQQVQRWLRAMVVLPLLFIGLTIWYAWIRRSPGRPDDELPRRRYFQSVLTLAFLAIGIRLITSFGLQIWVRFGDHGADIELERRILGLSTAAVLLLVGNMLPKILTPLSILPLHLAERVTSARRFIGTVLVLLGVAVAIAFVAMPLTLARTIERGCFVAGLATILGAIVWMNVGAAGGEP